MNKATAIDRLFKASHPGEVLDIWNTYRKNTGFDRCLYGFHAPVITNSKRDEFMSDFPEDFQKQYRQKNYARIDVAFAKSMQRGCGAFLWSDFRNLTDKQRKVFTEAEEAGLHQGLVIGLQNISGLIAAMSLASTEKKKLDTKKLADMELVANFMHQRYVSLTTQNRRETITLTDTEEKILSLILAGKSNSVIAQIKKCSVAVVKFHAGNILQKFGCHDRIQLTARAIYLGMYQVDYNDLLKKTT